MEHIVFKTNVDEQNICDQNIFIKNEKHNFVDYKNVICNKPWGHEFLIYQSNKIGIWFLNIKKGHETSLHTHFNKDTIIIVLTGSLLVKLFNNEIILLDEMSSAFIPQCAFHGFGSFSEEVYLMEIEIYNRDTFFSDKNDLLRITDIYKRDFVGYEKSVTLNTTGEYFYLDNNFKNKINNVDFKVHKFNSKNIEQIALLNNNNYNILLNGRIFKDFKYINEGSILNIDDTNDIQIIDGEVTILSLTNSDYINNNKIIYDKNHLKIVINKLNKLNKKIILTSGCFDIIHIGHINTLLESKKLGDILVVCLSNDEQIKKLKGAERPINNYVDRINLLKTISAIDYIVIYDEKNIDTEETLGEIMKTVNPLYWVKGTDYTEENIRKKHPYLKNIKLIQNIENKSSTIIINKIKDK